MTKGNTIKAKKVKDLTERIVKARSLMVVSINGLPSKQFQNIKKSIRESAFIKVEKKNILLRAIKELKKESVLGLEKHISDSCAFAISNLGGYELAGILSKKKTPVFAKAGQTAPTDIEVKEGPTDLVPGPAISELGALGIQISVENGKIAIKKDKVIVKEGSVITEAAAAVLMKLGVQPFSVGLNPVAVYDLKEEKVFTDLVIDSDAAVQSLKENAGRALGFAQKIGYYCKETIGYLLAKANMEGKALESKTQLNSNGGTA